MKIYKNFSVVSSCSSYKYHWGIAEHRQMSQIHRNLLISAKYNSYKLLLQQLQILCYFSFLCSHIRGYGKPSERHCPTEKCPCKKYMSWHVLMESKVARISHLYIKNKGFVQPESIVDIKVVVGFLIPDQTDHVHRSRCSLKLKSVPKHQQVTSIPGAFLTEQVSCIP